MRARLAARAVIVTAAVALCCAAWVPASTAVQGLNYPYDVDQFRDIAAAETLLTRGLADPFYAGETIWYNPLLPATIAGLSKIDQGAVHELYVASGPVLNLAAPLTFAALAWFVGGPAAAIAGLSIYLFTPLRTEPWLTPGYSPWLFPVNFAAAFFCGGVMCCLAALRRPVVLRWLGVGIALGLTFLAHTAPAIILGLVALTCVDLARRTHRTSWRHTALNASLVIGVALLVSGPFLWSIAGHYRLHIVNTAPADWTWPEIDVHHSRAVLARLITPWMLLPLTGIIALARSRRIESRAILAWILAATALFLYGWVQQSTNGLPAIVPQYHFYFYVVAALYLAAAIGVSVMCRSVAEDLRAVALSTAAAIAFAAACYPSFLERKDFHEYRQMASDISDDLAASNLRDRLLAETTPDAVILASLDHPLQRIGPAGRRTLGVPKAFSNPYVSFAKRQAAVDTMFRSIANNNLAMFFRLAAQYDVSHVLVGPADQQVVAAMRRRPELFEFLSNQGGYALIAVTTDSRATSSTAARDGYRRGGGSTQKLQTRRG